MASPATRPDVRYTYADYLTWPDNERWEIIEGVPYAMSPAPGRKHQAMNRVLLRTIANFLVETGGPCQVYTAPFDVRLPKENKAEKETDTVVQPDLVIICDKRKLDAQGCLGAPDMVIEIASPSTIRKDMVEKLKLYEKHKVKEYWLVLPGERIVSVYCLNEQNCYDKPEVYTADDQAPVKTLEGLMISLDEVFAAE